jgi:ATP-dependent DNA helicase DinG
MPPGAPDDPESPRFAHVNASALLGPDGPFARELAGFRPRAAQQEMAARVEQAIAGRDILIAESGTGTGKTFAYLVPALLSAKRTLIATGTKALQDQLFHRDLPVVRARLDVPADAALLKGRANYLCRERIKHAEPARADARALAAIRDWARRTRSGDIAEVADVPEGAPIWAAVTSTTDNCLGVDCPEYEKCFVVQARREAQQAAVVVVNHHLFFADLALREEGFGEILPGAETIIFDEAHQLPDVAGDFFGEALSTRQLASLARDVTDAEAREKSAVDGLTDAAHALERTAADLRLAAPREPGRGPTAELAERPDFRAALAQCAARLDELAELLAVAAPRGPALASAYRRASGCAERLARLSEAGAGDRVVWYETTARVLTLRATPVDIAGRFRDHVFNGQRAWIFTSATLAVGESFAHFQARLGLQDAETAQWPSPFDFAHHTLCFLPPGLPEPSDPRYTQAWLERLLPVLEASGGRAFLLFTSHRALKLAAEWLRSRSAWPLLVQGDAPRAELLARFRAAGNAVLLGAASFWEGVDVRGPALSVVAIDKLPFAAPDDPVFLARKRLIEADGGSAFFELQLPDAVIALKQGVGRLIRDINDRGVIVLGDPRLGTRNYGSVFLNSLPPMPRTHDIGDVRRFFEAVAQQEPAAHDVA